jgi:hypothetical protein
MKYEVAMSRLYTKLILSGALLIMLGATSNAAYLDECLSKGMQLNDGSYIFAVQCGFLDFFIYTDAKGEITKRNFVPVIWQDLLTLVDFIPEDRIYAIYQPDPNNTDHRGIVLDFKWKMIKETGLEGMSWVTVTQGAWWGLVHGKDGAIMREVSFDGYENIDHKLPEIKGADYYRDLRGFAIDSKGNWVFLFCHEDESGFSGNGIIRVMHDGKNVRQWIVDIPYIPGTDTLIRWVGPIIDHNDNIIVGHYENPCDAVNRDRVRIHKYTPTGVEKWSWGDVLYIISDIRVLTDGSVLILRPGGPIYKLSSDGKYLGEVPINGITILGEPDCGKNGTK